MAKDKSKDKNERRTGFERRQYEFALHIPERRRGKDRRQEDKRPKTKELDKSSSKKSIKK